MAQGVPPKKVVRIFERNSEKCGKKYKIRVNG